MTPVALDAVTCWQLTQSLWHTCWVGLVLGIVTAVANRILLRAPAWQRYWLNVAALAVMGACLPISLAVVRAANDGRSFAAAHAAVETAPSQDRALPESRKSIEEVSSDAPAEQKDAIVAASAPSDRGSAIEPTQPVTESGSAARSSTSGRLIQAAAPYITGIYLLGFYAMLLKLIVAIYGGKRLRAGCRPVADGNLLDMLARQSERLALRLVPVVACCERVAVPVVVGVIRPMILLPASMLTGLAPDELGAVLMHELAHIRRYDHWLILVQRFLEAVLFFHPVAWYLSRQIHAERERCCDDMVVAAGGDRLVYARTLLHVAELRLLGNHSVRGLPALAADGQRPSQLRQRVARLLGDAADPHVRFRNRWPALLLGMICGAALWIVTAGTWQLLAQSRPEKPSTVVAVVAWSAVVDEDVIDEIRRLDAAEKKQTTGAATETLRCSADALRKIIKSHLEQKSFIALGNRIDLIGPSNPSQRKTETGQSMADTSIIQNGQRSLLSAWNGGGQVSLEQQAHAARLKLNMHFGLSAASDSKDADVKFDENLVDGRVAGFVMATKGDADWKPSLIVVYEAVQLPADQLELFRPLYRTPDWVRLGPGGVKKRVARAVAWRAKAKRDVTALDPDWTGELPNGGHVQLVALSRPRKAPLVWWDPAGRPISGVKTWSSYRDEDLVALVRVWETGARRTASQEGPNSVIESVDKETEKSGAQFVIVPAVMADAEGRPSLTVGAGFGDWTASAQLQPADGATATLEKLTIHIQKLFKFDKNVNSTHTHLRFPALKDFDVRLDAVDRRGKEIAPLGNPLVQANSPLTGFAFQHAMWADDIDHFLIKFRPCNWAEFTNFAIEPAEPLEPPLDFSRDDANDDQASNDKVQTDFIARIPKGIEVELAAVAQHAQDAAEWYRPDGNPISAAEAAEATRLWGKWPVEPRGSEYRFLIRTRGLTATAGIQVDTPASGYRNAHLSHWRKSKDDQPDEWLTRAIAAPLKDEQAAISFRVRLTDGWGPVQAIDRDAKPIASAPIPGEHQAVYSSVKIRVDQDSDVLSRFKTTSNTKEACGVRLLLPSDAAQGQIVAVDEQGREHTSPFSGTGGAEAAEVKDGAFVVFAYFDMALSDVSRFEYKLRSFSREVLFEDVSLRPGQVTKVRIRAEALAVAVADKDNEKKNDKDIAVPGMTLPQIAERGVKQFEAIKTAHIKFRSSSFGRPFKAGITPQRCRELLEKYDLVERPDELRDLVNEMTDDERLRAGRPWSNGELHVAGRKVREAMQFSEKAADIQITDGQTDIRWNEANSQVNIDPAGQSHIFRIGLRDFWHPSPDGQGVNADRLRVVRNGGRVTLLFKENEQGHASEVVVDEATGFTIRTSSSHRDRGVVQQDYWLGWNNAAAGIPYPTVVVRFDYQAGQLTLASFRIVEEMRLNEPLPETIFQLGAPAGSTIFDSRNTAVISGGRINYDVFDVTSAEQLKEAAKPLDPEPKTSQEKFAVAELQRLYALADDEVLKRIGPPYPASRKHLPKLLGERYMTARRDIRSDCIPWKDGKLGDSWPYAGASYSFQMLITHLLKLKPTEIEGDVALLKREIPGDFVHRDGAAVERLAESLAEIAGLEFQKPTRLVFREVERPVYLARGELKLALPEGQKAVALNGGAHSGDHGESIGYGNLQSLLTEVATYIRVPVINETTPSSAQLSWSSRWYDLPTTKAEKRFKLDPQVVLRQITEQTGITFTEEKRTVRLLFVEEDVP